MKTVEKVWWNSQCESLYKRMLYPCAYHTGMYLFLDTKDDGVCMKAPFRSVISLSCISGEFNPKYGRPRPVGLWRILWTRWKTNEKRLLLQSFRIGNNANLILGNNESTDLYLNDIRWWSGGSAACSCCPCSFVFIAKFTSFLFFINKRPMGFAFISSSIHPDKGFGLPVGKCMNWSTFLIIAFRLDFIKEWERGLVDT